MRTARGSLVLAGLVISLACELNITNPATPTATNTVVPPAVTITNTNTNTNTNNDDDSDTAPGIPPVTGPGGGSGITLPLPTYAEGVTRDLAAANPTLLANSCQDTYGESAWQFLDLVIRTLRASDQRFGYLCKDANCLTVGADIVAYKATSNDTGLWLVDVIENHCPGPGDTVRVRWGVLPFELTRRWTAARKAGVFP